MKNVVLKIQGKHAVLLSDTGDIVRVKNKGYAVGQRLEGSKAKRTKVIRWAATVATALLLLFGGGVYAYSSAFTELSMDDPGIVITVNLFNSIVDAKAMDHDVEELIGTLPLKGQSFRAGMATLFNALADHQYLSQKENGYIMVTAYSQNANQAQAKLEELIGVTQTEAYNHGIKAQVLGETANGEQRRRAQSYGVTPGKLILAERYVESLKNPSPQDLQSSLRKPVYELLQYEAYWQPDPSLEGGDRTALLSGYPTGVLPLYKCQKVEGCSWEESSAGFDFYMYMLTYTTDTGSADVLTYYNKLLTTRERADAENLSGYIGGFRVFIHASDRKGQTRVTLSISLNADSEPYFANYPGTVQALGGDKNVLDSKSYGQTLIDTLKVSYTISYRTKLTVDEFETLYINEYGGKEGFQKVSTEGDSQVRYSFTEGDYVWEMAIDKDHSEYSIPTLTISCRTK